MNYQQYQNAYPHLSYSTGPCASNGYGWHGNGYGWQLDPLKWTAPSSAIEQTQVAEEPVLTAQKVEVVTSWYDTKSSREKRPEMMSPPVKQQISTRRKVNRKENNGECKSVTFYCKMLVFLIVLIITLYCI